MVTAQAFSERSSTEKWLLRALVLSLVIHVGCYGTWKWGQKQGWWQHVKFPSWMKLMPNSLTSIPPRKLTLIPPPKPQPAQLVFVDVDPNLADATPPKKAKYYSANNSSAANPTPKNKPSVEIRGRQDKVVKTVENAKPKPKPQPLQPSPPEKEPPQVAEKKPPPPQSYTPGDLAMAKPKEKAQEKKNDATVDNAPEIQPESQPVHHRPRTIAEAKAQQGSLGEKSRQEGGVNQVRLDSTLDAMKTSFGDYDRQFIDAVKERWYQSLENRTSDGSGRVVVRFTMKPNGAIEDVQVVNSEVSDIPTLLCRRAIEMTAPLRRWPDEMRLELGESRDVTFTFIYE